MFYAKVIADSISAAGIRLTTMELSYPRFIHSEFMTHRVFSRNAASSRAIPVAKMIEQVRTNPAGPVWWGKNQPGMQAHEELDNVRMDTPWGTTDRQQAKNLWAAAAEKMADSAESMLRVSVHKQIVNRLLEPWMWMKTIVTGTEWKNFFALRCHPDAQPEFQKLAHLMREAREASVPVLLRRGEWHLPYVTDALWAKQQPALAIKCSVARCARVSYLTHDGKEPDIDADFKLHDKLVGSTPKHASPAEHQATPDALNDSEEWIGRRLHGNLHGWCQYRQFLDWGVRIE